MFINEFGRIVRSPLLSLVALCSVSFQVKAHLISLVPTKEFDGVYKDLQKQVEDAMMKREFKIKGKPSGETVKIKGEIKQKMLPDEVIDFSETGRYVDNPQHYIPGQYIKSKAKYVMTTSLAKGLPYMSHISIKDIDIDDKLFPENSRGIKDAFAFTCDTLRQNLSMIELLAPRGFWITGIDVYRGREEKGHQNSLYIVAEVMGTTVDLESFAIRVVSFLNKELSNLFKGVGHTTSINDVFAAYKETPFKAHITLWKIVGSKVKPEISEEMKDMIAIYLKSNINFNKKDRFDIGLLQVQSIVKETKIEKNKPKITFRIGRTEIILDIENLNYLMQVARDGAKSIEKINQYLKGLDKKDFGKFENALSVFEKELAELSQQSKKANFKLVQQKFDSLEKEFEEIKKQFAAKKEKGKEGVPFVTKEDLAEQLDEHIRSFNNSEQKLKDYDKVIDELAALSLQAEKSGFAHLKKEADRLQNLVVDGREKFLAVKEKPVKEKEKEKEKTKVEIQVGPYEPAHMPAVLSSQKISDKIGIWKKLDRTPENELWIYNDLPDLASGLFSKEYGMQKSRFVENDYDAMKRVIKDGLKNDELLKAILISTENKKIINNTTHDYWGLGSDGQGPNNYGRILMELRSEMK